MPTGLRSYLLLLRWNLLRIRGELPVFLAVQTLLAAGVVVGFSLLIPEVDDRAALYLTSGAMTIALISVGMVLVPQIVAQQRLQGVFDYQRSLPVPRLALLAADGTVWLAVALPGQVATLVVAALRFDLSFAISPLLVPACLLVAIGAIAVGYGLAYVVRPMLVGLITQLVMLGALMFAPINYPADHLPRWAAAIHEWLPFQYMAQAVRETVDRSADGISAWPFVVLAVWGSAGLAITARVMTRRD